jgi:hypothetical protein
MEHKLINQFLDEIKLLYPNSIVYIDYINEPILIIYPPPYYENSSYEIELSSLHYTDSEGDTIIEECKKIFIQYRRQHNLEQLV